MLFIVNIEKSNQYIKCKKSDLVSNIKKGGGMLFRFFSIFENIKALILSISNNKNK